MKAFARILICLLLASIPAFAITPAFVSMDTCYNSASSTTATVSAAVLTGQSLVIAFNYTGSHSVSSAVFNTSENLTLIDSLECCGVGKGFLYRIITPTVTTANVVITIDTAAVVNMCVYHYSSVASFGTPVNGGNTSGTPTITCGSAAGQLVVDATIQDKTGSIPTTPGSGQTMRGTAFSGTNTYIASSSEAGAATVVMDWTDTGNKWIDICVSIVGTVGTPPARRRR